MRFYPSPKIRRTSFGIRQMNPRTRADTQVAGASPRGRGRQNTQHVKPKNQIFPAKYVGILRTRAGKSWRSSFCGTKPARWRSCLGACIERENKVHDEPPLPSLSNSLPPLLCSVKVENRASFFSQHTQAQLRSTNPIWRVWVHRKKKRERHDSPPWYL